MIKTLLIGASALALSAGAAAAQIAPQASPDLVTEISIERQTAPPVTNAEMPAFQSGVATGQRGPSRAAFEPGNPVFAGQGYVAGAAGQLTVPDLEAAGNKAAGDTDGNNNALTVDQTGGRNGWVAIDQVNDANRATVDQNDQSASSNLATENAAYIQQLSIVGFSAPLQYATVNQTQQASGNAANYAAILQGGIAGAPGGVGNAAQIDQNGTRLDASIVQGANAGTVNQNNSAGIQQTGPQASQSTANIAGIQQRQNSNAFIRQATASSSIAYVVQNWGSGVTRLDSDIVQQNGDNNYAANFQDNGGEADSFIQQMDGGGNNAFVNQAGTTTTAVSTVFQTGHNNFMLVNQTVSPTATSHQSQTGNGNSNTISQ